MPPKGRAPTTADTPLTNKQRILVAVYLQTWNISAAGRAAGYSGQESALRSFRLINVQTAIQKALKEAGLDADTVKARLSQQAQINSADFMIFEDRPVLDKNGKPLLSSTGEPVMMRQYVGVNWAEVERRGYLVKGIKYSRQGVPMLEFYDAQHALEMMGKVHGVFIEKVESKNINVEVRAEDLAAARDAARKLEQDLLDG